MAEEKCMYHWVALYITPEKKREGLAQFCTKPRGHMGDHESSTKVTSANIRSRGAFGSK